MQRERNVIVWPEFTDAAILREIQAGSDSSSQSSVSVLAGVFSVAYDDSAIWGSHERGEHLYLHRIARSAVNPNRGLVDAILSSCRQSNGTGRWARVGLHWTRGRAIRR